MAVPLRGCGWTESLPGAQRLGCPPAVLSSLKMPREALFPSPYHGAPFSQCRGSADSWLSWREGAPGMLCPGHARRGTSGPRHAWEDSCRCRIAGIPAEQSQLSTADSVLLRAVPCWGGTSPVTSMQPGTDPFPRGSPVFHNRRLCPYPSCRPDRYLHSRPPALAEGTTHTLFPPASSPPAPPCPYRSLILLPGCWPAPL